MAPPVAITTDKASLGAKANTIPLDAYVPEELGSLKNLQTAIPSLAKDPKALSAIAAAVHEVPTIHDLLLGDARKMPELTSKSVHLVLTSPPYWNLKKYRDTTGQLGHVGDYEEFLNELAKLKAVCHFWATRNRQAKNQGGRSGQKDQGARSAVTGGAHMDGFVDLARELFLEAGIPQSAIFSGEKLDLPGFFRPEKKWDLLVVADGQLIACIEFKSQVGPSFGNDFNNRTEESLGNATDLWTAYREGAFCSLIICASSSLFQKPRYLSIETPCETRNSGQQWGYG